MPADPDTQPLRTQQATQQAQAPGWRLGGRYLVLDRLGDGGMAEVFRAHDELLERDVAVKVFRSITAGAEDTHGELRREMELQALARLSHPHLITLFDGSLADGAPGYLVLELVHGPDLATRLKEGALAEPEVRAIGAQIADALAYVHAHGLVHRDVKPANILLGTEEGPGRLRARLSDFGIVRMIGAERMTSADLTLGTASYVAPEQARGADVEPPADVYALGLVLIEALTGARCFDGPLHEALAARLSVAPSIPQSLPEPWPALLSAMTARDPAQRPTAAEVATSLRAGVAPGPGIAPSPAVAAGATELIGGDVPPSLPPSGGWDAAPERPRRQRSRLLYLLGAIALAALLAGAGYLAFGDPGSSKSPAVELTPTTTSQTPTHHPSVHRSSRAAVNAGTGSVPAQPSHRHSRKPSVSHSVAPQPGSSSTKARSSTSATASTPTSSTPTASPSTSATTSQSAAKPSTATTTAGQP
ncbi:MAG TPA: protein kinase [Jatrophihabitans sp.]|nr:protein kinase [Jatrophihabitans sp.]